MFGLFGGSSFKLQGPLKSVFVRDGDDWVKLIKKTQHDAEVKRYRRALDNIKIRAYELGQKELHDMALEALKTGGSKMVEKLYHITDEFDTTIRVRPNPDGPDGDYTDGLVLDWTQDCGKIWQSYFFVSPESIKDLTIVLTEIAETLSEGES